MMYDPRDWEKDGKNSYHHGSTMQEALEKIPALVFYMICVYEALPTLVIGVYNKILDFLEWRDY